MYLLKNSKQNKVGKFCSRKCQSNSQITKQKVDKGEIEYKPSK